MNLAIISFHIWKILIGINVKDKLIFTGEVKNVLFKLHLNEFNYIFGIELEGLSKIYELVEKE